MLGKFSYPGKICFRHTAEHINVSNQSPNQKNTKPAAVRFCSRKQYLELILSRTSLMKSSRDFYKQETAKNAWRFLSMYNRVSSIQAVFYLIFKRQEWMRVTSRKGEYKLQQQKNCKLFSNFDVSRNTIKCNKKTTNWLGQAKRHTTKIWPKDVRGGIFSRFV